MERRRVEGISNREALHCLRRHVSRALFKTMFKAERERASRVVVHVDFSSTAAAVTVWD